jgi:hypothetical protein
MTTGGPESIATDGPASTETQFLRAWKLHDIIGITAFLSIFVAVVSFFVYGDIYHQHFFDTNYVLAYNLCRIILTTYLFFLVYASGVIIISLLSSRVRVGSFSFAERIVVGFFIGVVFWKFLMLVAGHIDLYTRAFALTLIAPLLVVSYFLLPQIVSDLRYEFSAFFCVAPRWRAIVNGLLLALVIFFAALLLLVKGLYPAGGHDYYTHYFYYLTIAVKQHSLWPNATWYQYFYSKSAGLFFLGMLLSDPLAPSLVTYCYVFAGAIVLFLLVRRIAPVSYWGLVSVALYFAVYIYTPGTQAIAISSDGWGEFALLHESDSAFILAMLWMFDNLLRADQEHQSRFWFGACATCIFASAYFEQPTPLLMGATCSIVMLAYALQRNWRRATQFFWLGVIAGAGFASQLILNYQVTGVPLDNFINLMWPTLNMSKIAALGWTFAVIAHSAHLADLSSIHHPLSKDVIGLLFGVFRLDWLKPVFLFPQGIVAAITASIALMLLCHRRLAVSLSTIGIVLSFALVVVIAAFTEGTVQPNSFYRYSSFTLPVVIFLAAAFWLSFSSLLRPGLAKALLNGLLPLILLGLTLSNAWATFWKENMAVVGNAERFLVGSLSLANAYRELTAWPARPPYGAIYPGALGAWRHVPPDARIRSLHIHTYCMAPDCQIESASSFLLSPQTFRILFGPPLEARNILRREDLNYFLVSKELLIYDFLPAAPLFSPDHIAEYFGVKWTDGTTYLLTWLGPGIKPLDATWVADYRRQVTRSARVRQMKTMIADKGPLRIVYRELQHTKPRWGADLPLPWLK